MFNSILLSLKQWNKTQGERAKLQQVYLVLVFILIIVAGLVGLLSDSLAQQILAIVFALVILFLSNAIVWALLDSFLLQRIVRIRTSRK